MNPAINDSYNQPWNTERYEGQTTPDLDVLSLKMTDEEIAIAIGNRVQAAESYWNANLSLDSVRTEVDKYYLNNYYSQDDLYDFQIEYKNNRLFSSIETLVALVVSRPPMPMVLQSYDTEASYELAQQLQKVLLCKYEDLYLKGKFQMIARHLLMGYRLAVMKYRWDDTVGNLQEDGTRFGDLAVDVVRPQRIVLDAGAQYIDDIPLIAEYRSSILDELCVKYPDKKDEILTESGKKGGKLTSREGYVEIHFTTYQQGKRVEGIVWKYGNVILDSMKSPFWNYDETYQDEQGNVRQSNFLTRPTKPYVLFNFLNLGKWVVDDTSLMEQAIPLQKTVNKIGRQIIENAEQANTGTIFNSVMVKEADVAKLLGDPGEKIMSTGDVREAATRLPYNHLEEYVIQEKFDARNEIDNIFATHGAIRGEVSKSKTLGQDVMSQRGDSARINVLATSIEDGADRLYKGITQCIKVLYDIPQLFRYSGEDNMTNFFSYGRDQVEDNASVRVKTGSILPEDPNAKKDETIQMLGVLDPLSIAEGLGKENPIEWAKRNFYYRILPDKYMTEVLKIDPNEGQGQDPSALQHIDALNQGQEVPPEPSPTKEHLATHQAFIEAPEFKSLPPEVQALHIQHVQQEVLNGKQQMGMPEERPGLPAGQGQNPGNPAQMQLPAQASQPGNPGEQQPPPHTPQLPASVVK